MYLSHNLSFIINCWNRIKLKFSCFVQNSLFWFKFKNSTFFSFFRFNLNFNVKWFDSRVCVNTFFFGQYLFVNLFLFFVDQFPFFFFFFDCIYQIFNVWFKVEQNVFQFVFIGVLYQNNFVKFEFSSGYSDHWTTLWRFENFYFVF